MNVKRMLLVLLLFLVALALFAQSDKRYEGHPRFRAGMPRRYVIWEEGGVFKLRTTTAMVLNRFSGAIYALGGTFSNVRVVRRDPGDYVRLSRDKKRLYFSFTTNKGVDGLNFETDASSLAYSLNINKEKANNRLEIFLGARGRHPLKNPFLLGVKPGGETESVPPIDDQADEGDEIQEVVPQDQLEAESRGPD